MAYLKLDICKKNIVVLLGPTGCGKTTYAKESLKRQYPSSAFLSTGDKLREGNYINAWQEPNMDEIKDFCHTLIGTTLMDFQKSESAVLILDCVKDLKDAEFVTAEAKEYGLQITAALLFDIHEEQLKQFWNMRSRNNDKLLMMCVSVRQYLYIWRMRSNDLCNYYKKLKLLFIKPSHRCSSWKRDMKLEECRIYESSNYLQFMLLESNGIKNVLASLQSVLNVFHFEFTLPASFVHCYRDVKWVANPTRYYVTIKADGVRCLLFKTSDGTYLITRKHEIYPCQVADDQLPENTVLDGELLPSISMSDIHPKMSATQLNTSVFLVFDVLAAAGDVLWRWPLSVRLQSLGELAVRKDIIAVMKEASSDNISSPSVSSDPRLTILCALKGHRPSTPEDIQRCLDSTFPYSCDGLVFTPDKAYLFGPDPLLFKWQRQDDIHCDLQLSHVIQRNPFKLLTNTSEVSECRWNSATKSWVSLYVRNDKAGPNLDKTVAHLKKICQQPFTKDDLKCHLTQVKFFDKHGDDEVTLSGTSKQSDCVHPVEGISFDNLFSDIMELVQRGEVEKTVDEATNLEIITYRATASFSNPIVRLSRGLVLHPPSKTVVTRPFVRFFEGNVIIQKIVHLADLNFKI